MPVPAYGVAGHAILGSRLVQILSLITVIGITAHCISELNENSVQSSSLFVGLLTISCLALVYSAASIALYVNSTLPMFTAALCDFLFFVAFLVASILVGKPIASLSCRAAGIPVPNNVGRSTLGEGSFNGEVGITKRNRQYDYYSGYAPPRNKVTGSGEDQPYRYFLASTIEFTEWIQSSKQSCYMAQGVWGLGIVVTVVFLASAVGCAVVWRKLRMQRKVMQMKQDIEKSRVGTACSCNCNDECICRSQPPSYYQ
ncbi:hypothetical protein BDZ91DRAFT_732582 [Kalaharituber pfeilii]|nr:hypothetical protein BDZ91DRAFT_732582 [Kalaharituber pfeilii]